MDRPLASSRPIGPIVSSGEDDLSEFDKIEVQTNKPSEEHNYSVAGIFNPGAQETVGLVVETDAIVINGDYSFAVFEGDGKSGAEFTAYEGGTVGIKEARSELVNIIIE